MSTSTTNNESLPMTLPMKRSAPTTSYGSLPNAESTQFIVTPFRWLVYFTCGLVMFSIWYSYFIPSGLETQFISYYKLSNDEYALLFSIATGPTFIVPIFAGIMVDKVGIGLPLILSTLLSTIAQIIFIISLVLNHRLSMYIARCLLGIGACCWGCSMNAMLAKYFIHNELAFALSLSPSTTRAGFIAADYLSYCIYFITGEYTVIWSVLCSIIFMSFSLIAIIITVILHRKWRQKERNMKVNIKRSSSGLLKKTFSDSFIKVGKDMGVLPLSLWIVVFIAGVGYVPFVCFTVIGSEMLQTVYGYDEGYSDRLLLLPCFVAVVGSPLVGVFIDKYGQLCNLLLISSVLFIMFHIYILYGVEDQAMMIIALCVLGVGFPMFATAMWSAVALIADPSVIGTANALCYMAYALLNAFGQYIAGMINDYYYVEVFFAFVSLVMFIFAVILLVYDAKTNKKLYRFKQKAHC